MADVSWTSEQQEVLDHRDSTLLVSAAAGSGKTAVLVERLIRRICDVEGANINEFVIVTYTNAAAAEMKEKIYSAISDRLIKNPSNKKLRRQLSLLADAQISTVHGFCQSLLREFFEVCHLSPDFRIADEHETKMLKESVLDDLIEHLYTEGNEDFLALVDVLSAERDDKRFVRIILETYEKLRSHPFPDLWMKEQLRELDNGCALDPTQTIYGKTILSYAMSKLTRIRTSYLSATKTVDGDAIISTAYGNAFSDDFHSIKTLITLMENGEWDDIYNAVWSIEFQSLNAIKDYDDKETLESLKKVRQNWKSLLNEFREKYFTVSAHEAQNDFQITAPLGHTLFNVVSAFDERFSAAKRQKNVLDFSDLEHFAVSLLVKSFENGKVVPTPLAIDLSKRYTEIMVDEYQDTNEVQDAIFKAISKNETNLFMVGDIKQSIYGFRLADPFIFLDKYLSFSESKESGKERKILLSKNFRSRGQVLDSVNYIFKNVMSSEFGDVDYTTDEYLYHGKPYPETTADLSSEFLIVETEDADEKGAVLEADAVAGRINQLLCEHYPVTDSKTGLLRDVQPGDIVILLRSLSSKFDSYANALERYGIPCQSEVTHPLLEMEECNAALSFLSVLDNPDDDISLVAVLRCPVYRFTTNDLARIRVANKKVSYYNSLRTYAESGDCEDLRNRCALVLADFDEMRMRAGDMTVGRFLWYLYDKTSLMALYGAFPNGTQRQANLIALFDFARRYEHAGYKGLYSFTHFIERLRSTDSSKIGTPAQADSKAVRIMSIHKSKGLEFPIVIVPDCAKPINMQDLTVPVLIHAKLGIGFKAREAKRRIEYPTLARQAIALRTRHETLSEELRILYVAMTRAKEKLIMSANVKNYEDYVSKLTLTLSHESLSPALLTAGNTVLPWLMYPLVSKDNDETSCWRIDVISNSEQAEVVSSCDEAENDTLALSDRHRDILDITASYVYPYTDASNTPSKATATGLKGITFDGNEDTVEIATSSPPRKMSKPSFLSDKVLSPSQRGTAHHMAMQFIDFSRVTDLDSVRKELLRLHALGFLTKAQTDAVECEKILAFFQSDIGKALLGAKEYFRERKFSLLASPATVEAVLTGKKTDEFVEDIDADDKLLIQGVIDCYFISDGMITLIDFKTDRCRVGMEKEIAERYRNQMRLYAYALERITGLPVKNTYLYLFDTDTAVLV